MISCSNGIDEATKIAFIIQKLIADKKCNYNDIALLYRMNLQHIPFKQVFFKMGIPHKISNANTIFDSKYIKIIYYYLQFIEDQTLDFCLPKIINFPKRGIGKSTIDKLFTLAKLNGVSCWEIINNCDNKEKINKYKISKEMQTKFIPFKKLINYLILFSNKNRLETTVLELLKCININEYVKEDSNKEQIDLLLEKVKEMEEEHIQNSLDKFTLNEFLEDFSLLVTNDESDEENESKKNRVKLMTIHQAKGLEFKYVFIVGLEEEYYPCGKHVTDIEELEEERRILYVAITRAKINCYLSYANQRLKGDETVRRNVSPFLKEIYDYDLIQSYFIEEENNYKKFKDRYMYIAKKAKKTQLNMKKKEKEEKSRKNAKLNHIEENENENVINQIKNNYSYDYNINKPVKLKDGNDIVIFATGTMVAKAVKTSKDLEDKGVSASVINVHTIKPLVYDNIAEFIGDKKMYVTVEEHSVIGGLGSAVADAIEGQDVCKGYRIGIPDIFPKVGSYEYVLESCGLNAPKISERILELWKETKCY